jgi:hypothetical protein
MRTQGLILVRARMFLRPVDYAAAHAALHRSACSRGYKLLREGADPKYLWWCMSFSSWSVRCVLEQGSISIGAPLNVAPCLPLYSSQGEGSSYICGKKAKWGKDEIEK